MPAPQQPLTTERVSFDSEGLPLVGELARQLHERAAGEKEIVWLDAGAHIDLYDVEPYVSQAVEVTAAFLHRTLT